MSALSALLLCVAVDGDAIRCAGERIRLLGIGAPELAGHCRQGRNCVAGDGEAAKRAMAALIRGRSVTIERVGQDRYGRTLGVVYANGQNLSCAMLSADQAEYIERWDDGHRTPPLAAD